MQISQKLLDDLWDFSDPVGSEERLRAAAEDESDAGCRAELLTQVARALGLQGRFEEADTVLGSLHAHTPAVDVRIALELGRVRNSSGRADAAVSMFAAAARAAAAETLTFLQVDALHMLAIADAERAEDWTAEALGILDGVSDPRTLRWSVSLHNNAGWSLLDAGRTDDAIAAFERAKDAAERSGPPEQRQWADEALAEARAAV
ncbi:hypothetical protein [Microbacterium thalassium]|uniref:Tetratricopeptide (TPR) repeat protein n=1 Tax=Microbacterium thalassium TaxID=362649 RepID=A0A7X0FTG7_9MICO|nr:hypothetical protein [Microbacterium thalassium]MBB6392872.1 tetratricopeptide (TPR) repeat protein [Microbacterium thalassium]